MKCALMVMAAAATALGFAEASTIAQLVSNYAKVSTNTGLTTPNNTNGYSPTREKTTTTTSQRVNETEYDDDFDDFDAEDVGHRREDSVVDSGKILNYFNGLVSLLSLMSNFGGRRASVDVGEARYVPDAATKKFKQQSDQERDPIGNYPPYNPLAANAAESYAQNDGKTSFDADIEQYKASDQSGWNVIGHDYPVYEPTKTWQKMPADGQQPWETREEYPSFHSPPSKAPVEYHDYHVSDDDHFHHHYHDIEDEDRESKRPYSYYFLGRKLWYIPLIFSVYFIIYIAALVLKSVARHKIQFPEKLWDLKDEHYKHRRYRKVDEITEKYENAIDSAKYKFM